MYTSPALQPTKDHPELNMLRECPVGLILRDAPYLYDVISIASAAENVGPTEYARLPRYMQRAMTVVSAERSRLRELRDKQRQAERDAKYGARVVRSHG